MDQRDCLAILVWSSGLRLKIEMKRPVMHFDWNTSENIASIEPEPLFSSVEAIETWKDDVGAFSQGLSPTNDCT